MLPLCKTGLGPNQLSGDIEMFKKKLLAGSVGMALSLAFALPVVADTILFDFDQDGVYEQVDSVDWAPGNALAVGAVPLTAGDTFTTYIQAEMTSVTGPVIGGVSTPIGASGPYEYTYVIELQETIAAAIDLDGDTIPDTVSFNHTGGTVHVYYDDLSGGTINADGLTSNAGTGYDDGIEILTADIIPTLLGASFSLTNGSAQNTIQALDQYNTDNLPGIETVTGSGNATVDANVTFYDTNFFQGVSLDTIIKFLLNATLEDPFDSNNPELLVGGVTPNYGANDINGLYGGAGTEDFQFEADANSSFKVRPGVPEPASIALLGAGLSLMGFGQVKRRRKQQA